VERRSTQKQIYVPKRKAFDLAALSTTNGPGIRTGFRLVSVALLGDLHTDAINLLARCDLKSGNDS